MDCEHAFDTVNDEGAPTRSRAVAEHLATCLRCARLQHALERGRPVLRSLPTLPISPNFADRLHARIAHIEHGRARRSRNLRVALGLGSGSALAALLALLLMTDLPIPRRGEDAIPEGATPSVRVVRPLTGLPRAVAGGPFAAALGTESPELELTAAVPWSTTFGSDAEAGPGSLAEPRRSFGLANAPWTAQAPVVFAAPSWSFAAAPAALRFVSTDALVFPPAPPR